MIKKIVIRKDGKDIYKGSVMNIPVKQTAIIKESIDLFDDDDPCIIHTSFIVKKFAEILDSLFKEANTTELSCQDYAEKLAFLDIDDLDSVKIIVLK